MYEEVYSTWVRINVVKICEGISDYLFSRTLEFTLLGIVPLSGEGGDPRTRCHHLFGRISILARSADLRHIYSPLWL